MYKREKFKLRKGQVLNIVQLLKMPKNKLEYFLTELELIIDIYSFFRHTENFSPKDVKNRLRTLEKNTEAVCNSIRTTILAGGDDEDRAGAISRRLLLQHFPDASQNALRDLQIYVRLYGTVTDLRDAARAALHDPLINTIGRRKNDSSIWFVRQLAKIYETTQSRKPGIGEKTPFFRFTKYCFGLAGHHLADPLPYIRAAVRDKQGGEN